MLAAALPALAAGLRDAYPFCHVRLVELEVHVCSPASCPSHRPVAASSRRSA